MFSRCYPPALFTFNGARLISRSSKIFASSHYEVLGLTPKATQAEIKTAYYKLSKVYHPDRNQGSTDASTKFRNISAAYEVLGNVRSRKLYDKGVNIGGEFTSSWSQEEEDPRLKFYKSRDHRHRATGRTPIYDFDEWSRAHYGATFARDMERKRRQQAAKQFNKEFETGAKIERAVFAFMFFVVILMYMVRDNYDEDRTIIAYKNSDKSKSS